MSSRAVLLCAVWMLHSKGAAWCGALSAESQAGTEQFSQGIQLIQSCLLAGSSHPLSRAVPVWLQGGWEQPGAESRSKGEAGPGCPSAVAVGAYGALAEAIPSQTGPASSILPVGAAGLV